MNIRLDRMVLKLVITLIGIGILFFGLAASAHTTKALGSLSLLMHIEPADRAVVGVASTVHISIADSAGKFRPEQCDCRILISQGGSVRADLPVRIEPQGLRLRTVGVPYTFTATGDHEITLRASPLPGAAFDAFNASFDATAYSPQRQYPLMWLIVPAAFSVIALGGVAIWLALRTRQHAS